MVNGLIIATKNGTGQSNEPHCAYLRKPKEKKKQSYNINARLPGHSNRNLAIITRLCCTFAALK